jgi:DNA-binding response OmpR family regulator
MTVVLLSSDLSVLSPVEAATARLGKKVRMARDASQTFDNSDDDQPELLIIDLSWPSLDDIGSVVKEWRAMHSEGQRIIAFGPHVHENRLAAARDAGCDLVVSRGQFMAQLETLLK